MTACKKFQRKCCQTLYGQNQFIFDSAIRLDKNSVQVKHAVDELDDKEQRQLTPGGPPHLDGSSEEEIPTMIQRIFHKSAKQPTFNKGDMFMEFLN